MILFGEIGAGIVVPRLAQGEPDQAGEAGPAAPAFGPDVQRPRRWNVR
jgi:hypothetical protein